MSATTTQIETLEARLQDAENATDDFAARTRIQQGLREISAIRRIHAKWDSLLEDWGFDGMTPPPTAEQLEADVAERFARAEAAL